MSSLLELAPFSLAHSEKQRIFVSEINDLTRFHMDRCESYRNILSRNRIVPQIIQSVEQVPFLPVRLFKHIDLLSVGRGEVVKTITSSGTTGEAVSRVFLDKETSVHQIRSLVKILQDFIGIQRMPMLIIDHPNVIKNRVSFSARGAGILGLSNFGIDHTYGLQDETMELDFEKIQAFLDRHHGKPILIFGFTFMVWAYFVRALESCNRKIDLSKGILLHSGGWKKLQDESVDNVTFKARVKDVTGIGRVHNFYGMAEQVGTVYVECEQGRLHAPVFSDVVIRDPFDWKPLGIGEEGLIQVLSILPRSYPGHSLLTEDVGEISGIDDCPCGRLGKTILIRGRIAKAEVRGCSDTQS
jgi:phenylacetate-coenzyme A ligase PaaK-like adenylate-forming protein